MSGRNTYKNENVHPFSDSDFTLLFNELYSPLCQYCLSLTCEKKTAEDIVQEQFIYIWENRKKMGNIKSLKSYLYRAVKNKSINHLRKQFLKSSGCVTENITEKYLAGNPPNPEEMLINKELGHILSKAFDKLPEKCRIIFIMKKVGELTNKEIADNLTISVKTVENQMNIAFKKLIEYISDHWK
ncbi:MAG: RNA polymerase sigma-70 factor [Bacteroidales bacterium]